MAKTQGTWIITETQAGTQAIANVSTVQNHAFGKIVKARDAGVTAYGEGEFVYVKGVASAVVGSWVGYNAKTGATTLATTKGIYPLGVMVSALNATTNFGWLQISGHCVGKCLTLYPDASVAYLTATPGSVSNASVIGDVVHLARGNNGATVTVGDLAGEFEISRPYSESRVSLTN